MPARDASARQPVRRYGRSREALLAPAAARAYRRFMRLAVRYAPGPQERLRSRLQNEAGAGQNVEIDPRLLSQTVKSGREPDQGSVRNGPRSRVRDGFTLRPTGWSL